MLLRAQTESVDFELKFKQQSAKVETLQTELKQSTDMQARLREAVEELERRFETRSLNNAMPTCANEVM